MTSANISTTDVQHNYNVTQESCAGKYEDYIFPPDTAYCGWIFDSYLCWPPTKGGEYASQKCPPGKGIDSTKFAERRCSNEGKWDPKPGTSAANSQGWTNYTNCYLPEILELKRKLGNSNETLIKMNIVERTRTLEIVGFSLSLLALVISLVIFYRFRSLRNNRTKIHKNLFIAMVIQVLVRLTLYIDQAIDGYGGQESIGSNSRYSIENTPYLCEAAYVLLEYARTAMFLWMFIEGLYLHNVVTVTVFQGHFPHLIYAASGWGAPVVMTAIWAGFTANLKSNQKCWFGYNLTPYYWILEGPRMIVILLNFVFLLNIIRVLVVKLRQSHTSDVEQVRKAVRAAFVLLPLLGITNLMNMTEAPLESSPFWFAAWVYTTHFLTSFQGFFIAMIYCFLNGEVRTAILKSISVYMSLRGHHDWAARRPSFFSGNYATNGDTEHQVPPLNGVEESRIRDDSQPQGRRPNWIRLFIRKHQMRAEPPPDVLVFVPGKDIKLENKIEDQVEKGMPENDEKF